MTIGRWPEWSVTAARERAKDLRRRVATRPERRTVVIFCEGEASEPESETTRPSSESRRSELRPHADRGRDTDGRRAKLTR